MIATRHADGIHISANIGTSLTGVKAGYNIDMHDPVIRVRLIVDATNADEAHRMATALCRREVIGFKQTGATIQRIA